VSSHVAVPGQKEGGGAASIRPALFRPPPPAQRERRSNKAAYQWPSTKGVAKLHDTHRLPPAAPGAEQREERRPRCRGGRTAAGRLDEPNLLSFLVATTTSRDAAERLKMAVRSKTNKVSGAFEWTSCRVHLASQAPPGRSPPKDTSDEVGLCRKFPSSFCDDSAYKAAKVRRVREVRLLGSRGPRSQILTW